MSEQEQDPNEALADEWAAAMEEQGVDATAEEEAEVGAEAAADTAMEPGGGESAAFDELRARESNCVDS
ncbi:MAG TPA: hypothetical protein ENJ50_10180, partial [Planctomycetaceae bacterium]|nr:hypothetical protein [Planctomycetaceae bacterium]